MSALVVGALDAKVRISAPAPTIGWMRALFGDIEVESNEIDLPNIEWKRQRSAGWHMRAAGSGSFANIDTAGALAETLVEINRRGAESVADEMAVLHAGTFEVDGVAVAVAGASGAGKSTTTAAAVKAGHGYLSDEVCAVEMGSFMVRPYHRPIGLRAGGAEAIGVRIPRSADRYGFVYPWRVSAEGRLAGPTPLGLVALLQRREGPLEIVELRPAEALVRLCEVTLGAAGRERVFFRRLEHLARGVKVVEIRHHDVFGAVDTLAAVVSR